MSYSTNEMMTVAAARRLRNGAVCFVGIGLPSKAANLARLTSSPDVVLIYESGPIGAKPTVLPLSIGDGELAETADTVVPTGEIFRYWLQGGRIDVGFLGAAQVDKFGNINTTVIGDYHHPKVRLPGAGGVALLHQVDDEGHDEQQDRDCGCACAHRDHALSDRVLRAEVGVVEHRAQTPDHQLWRARLHVEAEEPHFHGHQHGDGKEQGASHPAGNSHEKPVHAIRVVPFLMLD